MTKKRFAYEIQRVRNQVLDNKVSLIIYINFNYYALVILEQL
jgi:hypothetical protein